MIGPATTEYDLFKSLQSRHSFKSSIHKNQTTCFLCSTPMKYIQALLYMLPNSCDENKHDDRKTFKVYF